MNAPRPALTDTVSTLAKPAPNHWSIRQLLVWLSLACLLPGIIGSSILFVQEYQEGRVQLERDTLQTARALVQAVDSRILQVQAQAQVLANTDSLIAGDFQAFHEYARRVMGSGRAGTPLLSLSRENGEQIVNTGRNFGEPLPPHGNPEINRQVFRTGKPAVSDLFIGTVSGKPVVSVAVPVVFDGQVNYALSISIHTEDFQDVLRAQHLPAGWVAAIVDSSTTIVARSRESEKYAGQKPAPAFMESRAERSEGTLEFIMKDGVGVLAHYTTSPLTGWAVSVNVPQEALSAQLIRRLVTLALVISSLFVLGLAVARFMGERIARSVTALIHPAESLGQGREVVMPEVHVKESAELGTALARAAQLLREREATIRAKQTELEEANRRKDEFLAMLAHELRNPLAPIKTAAELLQLGMTDEKRTALTSSIISRQVEHMVELIDDLLDVSRVTRGLIELKKVPVSIDEVIRGAVEQVRPLIEARHHTLNLRLDLKQGIVLGDKVRLVQVFANLLTNAAKYTPENGSIDIEATADSSNVTIRVADNGNGIESALLPHIFELFTQGKRTPDRRVGGLGLGLALVKSLVDLHDGTVTADSDGLGAGSVFTVTLPLLPSKELGPLRVGMDERSESTPPPLDIMIVDDNEDAARMLATLLEMQGHHVVVHASPVRALQEANDTPPEVLILDIGMLEMDGFEMARRLRAQQSTAHSILVALTGYGQPHDHDRARAAGFDYYFVKPVSIPDLEPALRYRHSYRAIESALIDVVGSEGTKVRLGQGSGIHQEHRRKRQE